MGLESVVSISISRQTQGVSQAGFGTPLILGPNATFSGVRTYSSLTALADDFLTSTDEYKKAAAIFAQTPKPKQVKVRKTSTPVAQVVTVTPDVSSQIVQDFVQTINGVAYTFTSDADPTAAEVVTGLTALINADANQPVTASGAGTLILTADVAGESFTHAESANLAAVETTPNVGIASDILAAVQEDSDWYLALTTAVDALTVKEAAKAIEALRRLYCYLNNEAGARVAATTTDLFSVLKGKAYNRSFGLHSGTPADMGEAGYCGRFLPLDPGSETWAFKTIAGLTVDKWTDSEQSALDGKNANYYVTLGGVNIIKGGKVASGEWIDVMRFVDWLQARLEEALFSDIIRLNKIPMTDPGIAIVENDIRAVLKRGQVAGGIAPDTVDENGNLVPGFTVTVPKAKDISANDKAARKLTGVSFTAKLAGAVHLVEVSGVVTL